MKWFFCLNDGSPNVRQLEDLARVAVHTAIKRTRLEAFCVYDGADNAFTKWLAWRGVRVVRTLTPLAPEFKALAAQRKHPPLYGVGCGTFARMEIPTLKGFFAPGERVLYTDCDVMFMADPGPLLATVETCRHFAAAPEFDREFWGEANTGVLLLNVDSMARTHDAFIAAVRPRVVPKLDLPAWDQGVINDYYRGQWDRLPIELNWKPYWGVNLTAPIVHFHGIKPNSKAEANPHWKKFVVGGYKEFKTIWEQELAEARGA